MTENTKIEWADHTFNPWVGCQKVGPGCDNCYAEGWAKRSGLVQWGPGAERRVTTDATWAKPRKWNAQAEASGTRARVFCASLADVFDNAVPPFFRKLLWSLIRETPHLDWLLLTKRPGNIADMLPPDWGPVGWPNVWLGCTVVNQAEADRDIPKLLAVPARVHFLSMEPLLGPVRLPWADANDELSVPDKDGREHLIPASFVERVFNDTFGIPQIDWVITGGESGSKARPMHPDWARSLRDQCQAAGVAFFFKQWGEWGPDIGIPPGRDPAKPGGDPVMEGARCAVWGSGAWHYYDSGHQVDAETARGDGEWVYRLGKKTNARLLDGREWNELPGAA